MDLRIETESWKIKTNNENQKIIAGEYAVKCGKETIATRSFNDGYGGIKITIPAQLVAKVEEIDQEIRDIIVKSFQQRKE